MAKEHDRVRAEVEPPRSAPGRTADATGYKADVKHQARRARSVAQDAAETAKKSAQDEVRA